MSARQIIQFSEPVKAVYLAGHPAPPLYTSADLEAARREGARRGAEEAQRALERQMLEQREELVHLQSATFEAVQAQHGELREQFRSLLPQLVMEGVARILGGIAPDRAMVVQIVEDLLGELAPTSEPVEVQLSASDLELVRGYDKQLHEKFPAIAFRASAELHPGDAVIRSRFGVVDGRLSTKFRAVEAMFQ